MNPKTVGDNVKYYRKERKITQSILASKSLMTQQNVARIEKGEILPPIDTLEALANALDVSLLDLCNDMDGDCGFGLDFTGCYRARMTKEPEDVQTVMKRALYECKDRMIVFLRLSKSEQEIYKSWNGDKKDGVRFWMFLDEYGVETALNTPSEYVWLTRKLDECNGDKAKVWRAWFDRMIKKRGFAYAIGLPHNVNSPWLCREDMRQFLSFMGITFVRKR